MPRFRSALDRRGVGVAGLVAALSFACGAARAEDAPAASEAEGSPAPPSTCFSRTERSCRSSAFAQAPTACASSSTAGGTRSYRPAACGGSRTRREGDRTKEVLGSGREIRVGGPEPPKVEEAPPSAAPILRRHGRRSRLSGGTLRRSRRPGIRGGVVRAQDPAPRDVRAEARLGRIRRNIRSRGGIRGEFGRRGRSAAISFVGRGRVRPVSPPSGPAGRPIPCTSASASRATTRP